MVFVEKGKGKMGEVGGEGLAFVGIIAVREDPAFYSSFWLVAFLSLSMLLSPLGVALSAKSFVCPFGQTNGDIDFLQKRSQRKLGVLRTHEGNGTSSAVMPAGSGQHGDDKCVFCASFSCTMV